MRLDVSTFPVNDITFGSATRWNDGVLEINKQELIDLVLEDPYVAWSDIDLARPGDSTRIARIRDIIEPKVKADGPGIAYPGISGRAVETVGQGRTHRLGGHGDVHGRGRARHGERRHRRGPSNSDRAEIARRLVIV